jgi:hypothetical protein
MLEVTRPEKLEERDDAKAIERLRALLAEERDYVQKQHSRENNKRLVAAIDGFLEAVWMLTIVLVVALMAWALTGCAPVQCVRPVIDFQPPVLPTVSATELRCLTDSAYQRLAERDLLLHQSVDECRLILDQLTD